MEINLQQVLATSQSKELQVLKAGLIAKHDHEIVDAFAGEKIQTISTQTLKQSLAYVFTLIGLSNPPMAEEFMIIEDFIRSSYPQFTIDEFKLAFKLAVQNKLDCSVEHYEKFSPKFIGQVMNAYRTKANDIRKIQSYKSIETMTVPQLSENDIVEFTRKDWIESKRQDFNKVFNADKVFGILLKQGLLKFTPQQILKTIKIVQEDNIYRLNKLSHVEAKDFSKRMKNEDFIELQCKKLAIVKYFENLSS
jgi:hypothetical protein